MPCPEKMLLNGNKHELLKNIANSSDRKNPMQAPNKAAQDSAGLRG